MSPSAWRLRLLELLDSPDDVRTRDELIAAAAAVVPPGIAFRAGERIRQAKRLDAGARTRGDDLVSIDVGARDLARKALDHLVQTGLVVRAGNTYRRAQ